MDTFYIVAGQQRPLYRVTSARLVTAAKDSHLAHVAARLARSTQLLACRCHTADFRFSRQLRCRHPLREPRKRHSRRRASP